MDFSIGEDDASLAISLDAVVLTGGGDSYTGGGGGGEETGPK